MTKDDERELRALSAALRAGDLPPSLDLLPPVEHDVGHAIATLRTRKVREAHRAAETETEPDADA